MKTAKSAKRGGTSQAVVAESQSQSSPFDITVRQSAEAAIRESEGLSQAVLGSISTQIVVLDKKGKIIAVNDAWTRFTLENGGKKYLRRTGVGVSYFNVCRRAEEADAAGALEALCGIQAVLNGSQSHFTLEYPCHSPARQRWFTLSVNPLLGSSGGVVVTHYDITARKQAEDAASRYRAQLESVFHAIQDGIVVADMEGAFLLINEAQARMNGFPSVEAMKQNLALYQELSELSYPNGNPLPFEESPINKVLRGESIRNWELRARRRDTGQEWFLSFSGEPVRDAQGKQILAVVGTNDITESKRAEEAVRESEEKYRTLFESIDQGFCTIEVLFDENERPVDYRFLVVNPAFERQTGIENAAGRRMREIAPLHEEHWFEIYGHIALTGEPLRFENPAEQLHRFYDVYAWRVGEPAERKVAILFNDITERKRAEAALRESEDRIAGIINSAMDAIISVDEGQRVILFNAAAEKMFGYSAAEVIGQSISRLIPDRLRASHEGHIRRFSATGETGRAMGALGAISGLRRNGEEFPIEASISQLEAGAQKLFTVILRDITERKRAEEQLIEQAALLDQSHEAIVVRDLDSRVRYWGRGAERLYGWTAEEAVGRPVQELTYRERLSQLAEATRIVIEKGAWNGEMRHFTKDGREVIVEEHWTLVRDTEGKAKTILAINTDVTEKKKIEAQFLRAQRLESIGTLASGIAHDLNNILSPITTGAQMLQMKQQDEQGRRLLEIMQANAARGAEMIKQLLSFARGVAGERVLIQPKHLIREIVGIAQETFPRSIQIEQHLPEGLWVVNGDATQLHQAVLNLCVNARDAMPQGGKLTTEAENRRLDEMYAQTLKGASPGEFVVITVTDTGGGIPPEIIDRIFDPFFTTKEPGRGTGLGLFTVQGIVTGHGGFITVETQPGRGTKFKIYLPAHEATSLKQVEERYLDIPFGNGELILVIDDEAAVREMTGTALETFGYRVMTADNGATALGAFASHKDEIRVVITDMMMPVMDGLVTIRALQKLSPQVSVIASSGLTEPVKKAELEQLGVKTFLVKPYNAEALLKTVAQALSYN